MKEPYKKGPSNQYINFDTYGAVKRLCEAGLQEKEAESIVLTIIDSREYDLSKVATKEQLTNVEREVASIRQDLNEVKQDLNGVKQDIAVMQQDILAIRQEAASNTALLQQEISSNAAFLQQAMTKFATREQMLEVKYDILRWILPLLIGIIIAVFLKH